MSKTTRSRQLALVFCLAAAASLAGCEKRPRDPKPPSDPGRSVPKPITAVTLPAPSATASR